MYIRRKTRKRLQYGLFIVFLIVIAVGSFFSVPSLTPSPSQEQDISEKNSDDVTLPIFRDNYSVTTRDLRFEADTLNMSEYITMRVLLAPERIVLTNNCTVIPISITVEKSENLMRAARGSYDVRPTMHDLFEELVGIYDITVHHAAVDRLSQNIFYGHLLIEYEDKLLKLDARPSDAINIALRNDAPLYVHENILRDHGENICINDTL